MENKPEVVNTSLKLSRTARTKLKIMAARRGVSMYKLLTDIIEKAADEEIKSLPHSDAGQA